ncbi:MAG: PD-(D/E)XK nuclease family protein, partial [Patescibacteria group bacterium]
IVRGAIDDVWKGADGKIIVADYKATSKKTEVNLDAEWQDGYKRQMEVYQWLFRRNGFDVSDTGYFVYANANSDKAAFDGKLEFDIKIIPYVGKDDWVEPALFKIKETLDSDKIPKQNDDCDYCTYRDAVGEVLLDCESTRSIRSKPKAKRGDESPKLF